MPNTKVPIELSSTPGIIDNSTVTAITIDSAGAATFSGTVTADGLTVQTTNGLNAVLESTTSYQYLQFKNSGYTENYIDFTNRDFHVLCDNVNRFTINGTTGAATFSGNVGLPLGAIIDFSGRGNITHDASTFDIAFNTNSVANAFVVKGTGDATFSGYVDIGTTSAGTSLDLLSAGALLNITPNNASGGNGVVYNTSFVAGGNGPHIWQVGGSEKFRIEAQGNPVHRTDTSYCYSQYIEGGTSRGYVGSSNSLISSGLTGFCIRGDSAINFSIAGSNTASIDASGNLLVGTTSNSVYNDVSGTGIALNAGQIQIAGTGATLYLNRQGSDGALAEFRKDGATVGSIGNDSNNLYVVFSQTNNIGLAGGGPATIFPVGNNGAVRDNAIDLGYATGRFDDIYATNGTIQTSDRNEKQDIEALSDAEQRVAVAAKGLLRKFRWIDSVEEKGADARIHFGIIAQDLQDAFAAEGLDAGRYAMFISSTWWETQTEVEAVEAVEFVQAVEAVYDENGELVSEAVEGVQAVEAKDAYTRIDTFHTLADAPEGATERTRLGVRYSELLAFIIAAI